MLKFVRGILFTVILSLCACATNLPQALEQVRSGMDKDKVLEVAGDPARTFRENSQDHWIYEYFVGNTKWKRTVVFTDGKAVRITRPLANWENDLEGAGSMEEYEQRARAHQKKAGDFKSIDGDKD